MAQKDNRFFEVLKKKLLPELKIPTRVDSLVLEIIEDAKAVLWHPPVPPGKFTKDGPREKNHSPNNAPWEY